MIKPGSEPWLVAIGLGSNLPPADAGPFAASAHSPSCDPRARAIEGALAALARLGRVAAVSGLHETDPVDVPDAQPAYLNACALLASPQPPEALLPACEEIERLAGRRSKSTRGARPLDLDLLCAWRPAAASWEPLPPLRRPGLTLPHPRLLERAFVLVPLAGIAGPALVHAAHGRRLTVDQALEDLHRRRPDAAAGMRPGPAPCRDSSIRLQ